MGNQIEGKVCVVTGSGQGMGRASALEMSRQRGKVVVTDIKRAEGEETVELIRAEGGKALFVGCDLRKAEDIKALMETAAAQFGGIDVLHNNAGIPETDLTPDTAIDELSDEIWSLVYEVNLKAVWLTSKFATPCLKHSKDLPSSTRRRQDHWSPTRCPAPIAHPRAAS